MNVTMFMSNLCYMMRSLSAFKSACFLPKMESHGTLPQRLPGRGLLEDFAWADGRGVGGVALIPYLLRRREARGGLYELRRGALSCPYGICT